MHSLAASLALVFIGYVAAQEVEPHLTPRGEGTEHCKQCSDNALCEYRGISSSTNQPQFECVCKPAYEGNGVVCNAVNPCEAGLDNCDSNAVCKWIRGSAFTCACKSGFSGDGFSCAEVDECATENRCDTSVSKCVNTVGSYECACLPGFVHPTGAAGAPDTSNCVDLNECSISEFRCPEFSECRNTAGSYSCDCNTGFVLNNGVCIDFDECTMSTPHPCDQATSTCINLPAGFECRCLPGYQHTNASDRVRCFDINECSNPLSTYPANSVCVNTAGSYTFLCNSGYQKSADGSACDDVDECVSNPCDASRSVCTNTPGGYECTCNAGFVSATTNKKICSDVDECAVGTDACDKYATCENTLGGYTCTCFYGYVGDGQTCTEASPSLAQLEKSIANLSAQQLYLQLHTAYYENLYLKTELERYRRLCPLKKAGLLPASVRAKRDLQSDLNALTSGSIDEQRFKLQSLLHANSEVSLQISILKRECGFN